MASSETATARSRRRLAQETPEPRTHTHAVGLLVVLLPREADTWPTRRRGPSAVEVLHGALFLRQPQELLADRFDEGG